MPQTFTDLAFKWRDEANRQYELEFAKELEELIEQWDRYFAPANAFDKLTETGLIIQKHVQDVLGTRNGKQVWTPIGPKGDRT